MPSLAQLEKLLALEPGDPFLLYGMAQELARLDRHEEALTLYDRCLAADPSYLYAYFHKARSLESLDRLDDAKTVLRTGLAHAERSHDAHAASELSGYLGQL